MDKTILRKFATESRVDLMDKIRRKINLLYIDEKFNKENKGDIIVLSNEQKSLTLTKEEYENREKMLKRVKELGIETVIEESAYTWFNRIIAIRYMELHDFLPLSKNNNSLGIRVLSSQSNEITPDILKFSNLINPDLDINFNKEYYSKLVTDDKRFKYLILLICKKLGKIIPQVFGGVTDYIDLLIPDNMILENGLVAKVVKEIPINNFKDVEIIGWLYQYYIQNEKDKVMAEKRAYKKHEIPYVTELFTPDWIVKYMVENSLGRLAKENGTTNLGDNWKYYIEDNLSLIDEPKKPTEITFIDPCCGSGHILVYAFEVFMEIYKSYGYNSKEIPELILRNNLYGLDIDDRAEQLSILSVILKAREYDNNLFNKDIIKDLNIMSIRESNNIRVEDYPQSLITQSDISYLIDSFYNAKELGSLLKIDAKDFSKTLEKLGNNIFDYMLGENLKPLIKQSEMISKKYDVVVTNPPYLGVSKMSDYAKKYIYKHYPDSKTDLFAVFLDKNFNKPFGYKSMINQQTWMFLNSYEDLRKKIILEKSIISMIQLGTRAFEDIGGEIVQTTTFVIKEAKPNHFEGKYYRLVDIDDSKEKEKYFLENKLNCYKINQEEFLKMPNYIIGYWMSEKIKKSFENIKLKEIAEAKSGIMTGDDNQFVKEWYEVNHHNISFDCMDYSAMTKKWYPITRGGLYRKWYGNLEYVINLENDAYGIKNNGKNYRLRESKYYFKPGITWTMITTKSLSVRMVPDGVIFGNGGPTVFLNSNLYYYLALLNSNIINKMISFMNPTMNIVIDDIENLPIIKSNVNEIEALAKSCVSISKEDWDSFEISWEFKKHPLIQYRAGAGCENNQSNWSFKIKNAFECWQANTEEKFKLMKQNEEEINRKFMNMYGLQEELDFKVTDKEISIRKADKQREMKSLISYAVGCIFGRYSLDEDGLIYVGGTFDKNKYSSYKVDEDNIIPISDEDDVYYNDDIVGKFKKFIEVAFGKETLNENLDYIADTLGKKDTENSIDTIRRYFVNEFYKDHLQMYQKRPIYWQFESGKNNGFKCLIYMHRYDEQTLSKIRVDYLHKTESAYKRIMDDIDYKLNNLDLSVSDRKNINNKKIVIHKKITECAEYDEKVGHLANQMISIDLDDGVKINYNKFKDVLTKIK